MQNAGSYPTDAQLKEALRLLVSAIPEEKHSPEHTDAANLIYEFIEYHAQP
jgi:hypothetical protein